MFSDLKKIASSLSEAMLTGNLSASLGVEISDLGISSPVPSPDDPEWNQVASEPVQRESVSRAHVATVAALVVVTEPIAGEPGQLFKQQPCIMAVDTDDNCVPVGVTLWELDVVLVNFQDEVVTGLNGTTRILFTGCWANFTDLSISANGTRYRLRFQLRSIETRSGTLTVGQSDESKEETEGFSPGPNSRPDPNSRIRSGIIAGAVLGGLLLCVIIFAVAWKMAAHGYKSTSITGRWAQRRVGSVADARTAPHSPPVQT